MKYLLNTSTDPYWNMGFDEYVLEHGPSEPVFYLWRNSPSVIIGLNQNPYAEVNLPYLQEHGIALVRRITGGGAVYHDLGNLNYSIVGPSRCFETDKPVQIAKALKAMGVPAELSGRNDIFVSGGPGNGAGSFGVAGTRTDAAPLLPPRKCSGYAKRMSRNRMMIHGTLMFDVNLEALVSALSAPGSKVSAAGIASVRSRVANLREYLPGFTMEQFTAALQEHLAAGDGPYEEISPRASLGRDDKKDAPCHLKHSVPLCHLEHSVPLCHLEQSVPLCHLEPVERSPIDSAKFRSWEWIYGRSPQAEFCRSVKLSCGTVQVSWSLRHGRLSGVRFGGDFIGLEDSASLAALLEGVPFTREALTPLLQDASSFFDSASPSDLLAAFDLP